MKQAVPFLNSLCLCCLLLCLVLLLLPLQTNTATSAKPQEPKNFFSCSMEEIDKLTFSQKGKNFTLLNCGDSFSLAEWEQLSLCEERINALLALLQDLQGEAIDFIQPRKVPDASLTLHRIDGQQQQLSLYIENNQGILFFDGKAILCDLEKLQPLLWQAEDYLEKNILSMTLPKEGTLQLSGAIHPEALTLSYYIEESGACISRLTAPKSSDVSKKLPPLLESLCHLQAEEVVALSPTEEELAQFGLSEPFCKLLCDFPKEKLLLRTSPVQNGFLYLMKNDLPMVYRVSEEKAPWLSVCAESLTEESVFTGNYADSTILSLEGNQQVFRFSKWNGQVLQGNHSVDEQEFFRFYRLYTELIPKKAALSPPNEHLLLSLTISYTNPQSPKDNISFYYYDENYCALSINGTCRFLVDARKATDIWESCMNLCQ